MPPEAPQPKPRASACSAITDDNEVFVFSGRPLETKTRGPLGAPLDDLWSFNASCPKVDIIYQPNDASFNAPPPPAYVDPSSAAMGWLRASGVGEAAYRGVTSGAAPEAVEGFSLPERL